MWAKKLICVNKQFQRSRIETFQLNDLSRHVSRLTCLLHRHVTLRRKHDQESRSAILRPMSEFGAYRFARNIRGSICLLVSPGCFSRQLVRVLALSFFYTARSFVFFFTWKRSQCCARRSAAVPIWQRRQCAVLGRRPNVINCKSGHCFPARERELNVTGGNPGAAWSAGFT